MEIKQVFKIKINKIIMFHHTHETWTTLVNHEVFHNEVKKWPKSIDNHGQSGIILDVLLSHLFCEQLTTC